MTQQYREQLAGVYNTLASMIPVPSEEFSTKHAFCLQTIRTILQAESEEGQKEDEQ